MFAVVALLCIVVFIIWSVRTQHLRLIHKLFIGLAVSYGIWVLALLIMKFVPPGDTPVLFLLESVTNITGTATPTFYLCISLAFLNNWEHLPRKTGFLFAFLAVNAAIILTNPLHHLEYRVFSIVKSEVVFGPYVVVSGLYCYLCLVTGMVLVLRFALKNHAKLYTKQCALFALSGLCPLIVSVISTATTLLPITATPLSFIFTIFFDGIAIYRLHMLDIRPMATQLVLDSISDAYMILSDQEIIISCNRPFSNIFTARYGLKEGASLRAFSPRRDSVSDAAVYNLISAVETARQSVAPITYEQSILTETESGAAKSYYMVDVSPVVLNGLFSGCMVLFKDVTQLKASMQRLQDSQAHLMEQERLAFLGQMMGGLAHNLKTPIMSISGCTASIEALTEECRDSLDDPQVTKEDYQEIMGEIDGWLQKIRDASAYMSDIITAIKGQAATAVSNENAEFTVDELFKRVVLLMRHELVSSHHQLDIQYAAERQTAIHGDINSLIQVLDNFISNAIYAQKEPGEIVLGVRRDAEHLQIFVKDHGSGVSPQVRGKLFREMVTSKGTHGTGLGLFLSQAVVHGNFGGTLWQEDNPEGGATFGVSIPLDRLIPAENAETGGTVQ